MTEKLQDMENEAMSKIVELEKQLMQKNKDLDSIRVRLLHLHIHLHSRQSFSSRKLIINAATLGFLFLKKKTLSVREV